jgi:hypothetical protein
VIISSDGKLIAMPYSAANSMMTTDKIVVDRAGCDPTYCWMTQHIQLCIQTSFLPAHAAAHGP